MQTPDLAAPSDAADLASVAGRPAPDDPASGDRGPGHLKSGDRGPGHLMSGDKAGHLKSGDQGQGHGPSAGSDDPPIITRWFTAAPNGPLANRADGGRSQDPDGIVWERRTSRLTDHRDGSVAFEQPDVEVPRSWSQNATNILAQKYFRGEMGSSERETSLRQVVDRIAGAITDWGDRDGYFADPAERDAFRDELSQLLITQRAAFNSPVWFNIGVKGVPQQASACFILSVDDSMESILEWYSTEARIFKGGSGSGVNLSSIRAGTEPLRGGGTASGPVSFMRGADASAGTIKSGGKTRRAAKMVILDADHPDISDFIWCKAREERKARALASAGFDMSLDGADTHSIQYQNANNSVRLSDDFMRAAVNGADWELTARTDGSVAATVGARSILRQIAEAAWECADPGVQFDDTINAWNTAAATGRINASNPCSEYVHLDDSACNLASINLLSFLGDDGAFDADGFAHAVTVMFTAQEILVGNADYPTPAIAATTRAFRQLGLGYANLGALLMAMGLAYDSDEGRAAAAAVTSLMTGQAYATSARLAARMGPFAGFHANREPMLGVLERHREANAAIDAALAPASVLAAARRAWDEACRRAAADGVRNSQATVLAPTGTIGLLMDCDTTGIEPDLMLVKVKQLVGGGTMTMVNRTVPRALRRLGYDDGRVEAIVDHVERNHTVLGAPGLDPAHAGVFACSLGDNSIHYLGHVKMMAAVQPFLSGAISKTVNLPESATVAEIEELLVDSWRLGLKSVALYRDNCKVVQPLTASTGSDRETDQAAAGALDAAGSPTGVGSSGHAGPSAAAGSPGVGSSSGAGSLGAAIPPSTVGPPAAVGAADTDAGPAAAEPMRRLPRSVDGVGQHPVAEPVRRRLPRNRRSQTFEFRVADCKGFATVGEYDDGRPGEVFVRVSKQGSTLAGIMDAFAISVSHGLQYGVPLRAFVDAFVGMRFEPAGMTDDTDLRIATSLIDYLFRKLAVMYLDPAERAGLGILTTGERTEPTLPGVEEQAVPTAQGQDLPPDPPSVPSPAQLVARFGLGGAPVEPSAEARARSQADAPMCMTCGVSMLRTGPCHVCAYCGATSGCS